MKKEDIINYIAWLVILDIKFADEKQYKMRKENLNRAIEELIDDWKILINN